MPPKGYIAVNITIEVAMLIDEIKKWEGFHSRDETVRYVIRWYHKALCNHDFKKD